MSEPQLLLSGLGIAESVRWRDGRAWVANWGSGEVLAVGVNGDRETVARLSTNPLPLSFDWLPDGRLLIVDGPQRQIVTQGPDRAIELYADLSSFGPAPFNELVVDAAGNGYVNGGPGLVVLVRPDGSVDQVADGLQFPNGMALLDGDRTLVVADSHAKQLVGFDVEPGGGLSGRRVWAAVEHAPDGICADTDGAIWYASVPGQRCERVEEGGRVLDTVTLDRGCFACMLGGPDGRTLHIGAAEWLGMDVVMTQGPGTSGGLYAAAGQPAAHAGRP